MLPWRSGRRLISERSFPARACHDAPPTAGQPATSRANGAAPVSATAARKPAGAVTSATRYGPAGSAQPMTSWPCTAIFRLDQRPAAGRLDDRLLTRPQVREPVRPRARIVARRDVPGLIGREEPGGQPGHVQAGHQVLDVDTDRAAGADGHRDQVSRVRDAGVQAGPRGREFRLAVSAGGPGERGGLGFQLAGGHDPERAVRDREPLLVALVQECRGPGTLAVVEHVPAPGCGIRRQVNWNDPDADQIGHDRTSAISAARRRTPSSIWSAASALHDSRIAWLPPPSR